MFWINGDSKVCVVCLYLSSLVFGQGGARFPPSSSRSPCNLGLCHPHWKILPQLNAERTISPSERTYGANTAHRRVSQPVVHRSQLVFCTFCYGFTSKTSPLEGPRSWKIEKIVRHEKTWKNPEKLSSWSKKFKKISLQHQFICFWVIT